MQMRLTRQQINGLSKEIVSEALRMGLVRLDDGVDDAIAAVEKAIAEDLAVEDRLNDEVREILKAYQKEIEQGRMDYNTMYELVKKKLVKERGIII